MKPIKAVKEFSLNGKFYSKNDIVEIKNKEDLIKLNEKGFIEPLTIKDIQNFEIEEKRNFNKKEE